MYWTLSRKHGHKQIINLERKEHYYLFIYGYCYKCGCKFLTSNSDCIVCKRFRRVYKTVKGYSYKLRIPTKFGPTMIPGNLMDQSLTFKEEDEWQERERRFYCKWYDDCLDYVAKQHKWPSFTCRWCELDNLLSKKEQGELNKLDSIRLQNYKQVLKEG